MTETTAERALRFNQDKPRWSLVPNDFIRDELLKAEVKTTEEWRKQHLFLFGRMHRILTTSKGNFNENIEIAWKDIILYSGVTMEEVCQVMTEGAKKYPPHNWQKGFPDSGLIDSCLRHLYAALIKLEEIDPETGCRHVAHAMWNLLALEWQRDNGKGERDMHVDVKPQPVQQEPVPTPTNPTPTPTPVTVKTREEWKVARPKTLTMLAVESRFSYYLSSPDRPCPIFVGAEKAEFNER